MTHDELVARVEEIAIGVVVTFILCAVLVWALP